MDNYYILIEDKDDYKSKTYTFMTSENIHKYKDKCEYYGQIKLFASSKVEKIGYNIYTTDRLKIIKIGCIDNLPI